MPAASPKKTCKSMRLAAADENPAVHLSIRHELACSIGAAPGLKFPGAHTGQHFLLCVSLDRLPAACYI